MLTDQTSQNEVPIACEPLAVPADQRERWMAVGRQMYAAIEEIRDLPDGYAFRMPNTPEMLMIMAEDVNMERLCCPFLRFTIEVEPNHGPFWLHFTGGEGAKDYLKMAFESTDLIDKEVARAAGFSVSTRAEMDSVATVMETAYALNQQVGQSE